MESQGLENSLLVFRHENRALHFSVARFIQMNASLRAGVPSCPFFHLSAKDEMICFCSCSDKVDRAPPIGTGFCGRSTAGLRNLTPDITMLPPKVISGGLGFSVFFPPGNMGYLLGPQPSGFLHGSRVIPSQCAAGIDTPLFGATTVMCSISSLSER
jgi:hypothetical protein